MPEGTDSNKLTETARILAPAVLARGWNLTTRMHQFIWGNERAR
jgi:hypothetical protein